MAAPAAANGSQSQTLDGAASYVPGATSAGSDVTLAGVVADRPGARLRVACQAAPSSVRQTFAARSFALRVG